MSGKKNNQVVARLTITRADETKTIIEVWSDATFSNFFKYFRQTGMKRSTKALVGRTIPHRKRRCIRDRTLFKETRPKECMLAISGSSVVPTEATGG